MRKSKLSVHTPCEELICAVDTVVDAATYVATTGSNLIFCIAVCAGVSVVVVVVVVVIGGDGGAAAATAAAAAAAAAADVHWGCGGGTAGKSAHILKISRSSHSGPDSSATRVIVAVRIRAANNASTDTTKESIAPPSASSAAILVTNGAALQTSAVDL